MLDIKKEKIMEYIIGFVLAIVIPTIILIGIYIYDPIINKKTGKRKSDSSGNYVKEKPKENDNLAEIIELNSMMNTMFGGSSKTQTSEKEKRIEDKRKQVAELEKVSDWQRHYDPAWDTESYTGNDWDNEEKKLDHKIGNLEQQNISYGNWEDFEDRRTYKDEDDPTEKSEDWK